jgi:A1 cistron-splicing factor AAR2
MSIKSHNSVRATGTIPYGQLRIHEVEASDSESTERGIADAGTEEVVPYPRPAYLEKGDVFRMLDLPDDFVIGLDAIAMTTSTSLAGFRDITPGAHFLWVQQPGGVSRCGYWFVTRTQGVVRLKQWDRYNEVLGETASRFEARDEEANIESVYPTLQPYTLTEQRNQPSASLPTFSNAVLPDWARSPSRLWDTLTSAISPEFLDKVTGKKDAKEYLIDSMDCAKDSRRGENLSASKAYVAIVSSELSFLFAQDFRDLQLLDLGPMKSRVADTSPRVLALLGCNEVMERDIVAELQFTFLTGTNLSNSACLEQWWNLVLKVVLRAYSLAISRPQLARDLLQTLYAQLFFTEHYVGSSQQQQPDPPHGNTSAEGTKDGPSSDRAIFQYKPQNKEKLRLMLAQYKRQLNELLLGVGGQITPEQEAVGRAFEDLEIWLWKCNWDLRGEHNPDRNRVDEGDSEDEDDPPVVVELDEDGREVGMFSFRD